ncbi:MAG: histidinol-phosphate transaminase [Sedimentisphaerales bacterium]|nr:histidinol-phosphate transaminase [Sedimentisphaerales bacterium]
MGYFRKNIEQAEGYTPGLQPHRAEVTKLNTNENPYPPSPAVLEVLSQITSEQLRRYPDPNADEFRQAAARINGVEPGCIMCGNGGDELLKIALQAFCDNKRPVSFAVPTYTLYAVLAKLNNCKAIEVAFDKEFNLPAKLSATPAALTIVCNPNAPTGSIVSREEMVCLADEIKGVLLVDEAYVDFAQDNCTELIKDFKNVLIIRSMSKGYGLAGIRFGYAIAQPSLIAGLMKVKDSYNVNTVSIAAAAAAIKDQKYFRRNIEKTKKERERLTEQLRQLGFTVPKSHANFVLAENSGYKAAEIYDKLLQRDILVRFFPVPGLENKLRITIGTSRQNDILLDNLKEILPH